MSNNENPHKVTKIGRINRRQSEDFQYNQPQGWWQTSRRKFVIGGAIGAGVLVVGGLGYWAFHDDTTDVDKDALDLQRAEGWNVGSEDKKIALPNAQTKDSQQTDGWRAYLDQNKLLATYQPQHNTWLPFFVPTLAQSLQFETLRNQLMPIFTPDMQESYERGQTIAKDFFANAENPAETAVIVDLLGRDSVALGAGMADVAQLVTTFDNFPHPLGVTPSHETLAAMLYYAGEIANKKATVNENAPVVFLLDNKRLTPYTDADMQFDNRYLAKLPSAQKLQEKGVKSIIYVTADRTQAQELDDLNEDFVDYRAKGLNVAMFPLNDLTPVNETVNNTVVRHYYYGGSPASHMFFFYSYPFYRPTPIFINRYPTYRSVTPTFSPPRYVPAPRPTMFAGTRVGGSVAGVGRSKPSGFGRATVRVSASSGRVVGTRAGRSGYYSSGRSGSFGRGGGYSG